MFAWVPGWLRIETILEGVRRLESPEESQCLIGIHWRGHTDTETHSGGLSMAQRNVGK